MSLITSCPACGTMFRVVPDQLKISEGWVRCGHCGEVFDATAHLTEQPALEAVRQEQAPAADGRALPAGPSIPAGEPPPGRQSLLKKPEPELRPEIASETPPAPETQPAELPTRPVDLYEEGGEPRRRTAEPADAADEFVDSDSLRPSPLDTPFVFRRSDLGEPDDYSLPPAPRDSRFHAYEEDDLEEPTRAELEAVSFVRQARRQAFWRRPSVRIVLVLASFVLAVLLVAQLVWQDRDRLALAQPALRPALERMCGLLGCRLTAPRQIEAIVIEHSGFNRLRNDTYRLAFTLRNTAPVAVAVPAMELTLTDPQDQPIARRVLAPAEFGAASEALPPAADWSRSVGLVVQAPAGARVAGYRLLAFYP